MFGLFDTGQVCGAQNDDTHIFEHIRLRSKIVEFRHGKPNAPQSYPWVVEVDAYKTVGVGERKRTEQHGVHDAENRRIGSHAQSQCQESHDRECGLLDQHAQTIANILKYSPHERVPLVMITESYLALTRPNNLNAQNELVSGPSASPIRVTQNNSVQKGLFFTV